MRIFSVSGGSGCRSNFLGELNDLEPIPPCEIATGNSLHVAPEFLHDLRSASGSTQVASPAQAGN